MDRRLGILHIGVLPLWSNQGDAIHAREMGRALRALGFNVVHLNKEGPVAPTDAINPEVRVSVIEKRFLRQVSWNIRAADAGVKATRKHGLDIIYTRLDPGMTVGRTVARRMGLPLVVEINGLPTIDVQLYRPSNAPLRKLARKWENGMYQAADLIVGAPGYVDYVREHFGIPQEKCCVAPLGVNPSVFVPRDRKKCLDLTGESHVPTVVWTGVLQGWQGLPTLIAAAGLVRDRIKGVRFLIVGDGPERRQLESLVDEAELADTVRLVGRVPYEQVQDYIGLASLCVATFPGDRGVVGAISSLKIMTYLSCGRPVVTSDMDEMGPVISSSGAGASVSPDDPSALADSIVSLLISDDTEWRARCNAARSLAESRTWAHKAKRVASALRELVT